MAVTTDRTLLCALVLIGASMLPACRGKRGSEGPPGPPGGGGGGGGGGGDEQTDDELVRGESVPGIVLEILSLDGASGPNGSFEVNDTLQVGYRLVKTDGTAWELDEMSFGRILVSGPSFNYQRVLPERDDLATLSTAGADEGEHAYVCPTPLPATYAAPYNDSGDFDELEGELTGQALLDGTYTLGISFGWRYTVEGRSFVDVGEASIDFLVGTSGVLDLREVVTQANCDRCHVGLQAHDGERRELVQCLMCHTSGAEDSNDPDVGGGTPQVTVDSRVLFHRIHNAAHLPSVQGVGVHTADGIKDYTLDPEELVFATSNGLLRDYSFVGFPAWPNRTIPMPKDFQYSALSAEAKAREDAILRGITSCRVCHGDPDGSGPLVAPEDGDLVYAQPSRKACGACHDDVDWDLKYVTNGQTMEPQPDSSACKSCHEPDVGPLAVREGHRHPLDDPGFDPGLVLALLSASESGANDGDGSVDEGEGITVTFTLRDDSGADVDTSSLEAVEVVLSGPTLNSQLVLRERIPTALLGGAQPFTVELQERVQLEFAGDSTAAPGEVFTTALAPHLDVEGAETNVLVRTSDGAAASTLAKSAAALSNYLDLDDASAFERDDWIVIDDGVASREEYLRIQLVQANRLWFSSPATPAYPPGLVHDHDEGADVREVVLDELVEDVDYALDEDQGEVTELSEFGAGNAVVVSYTTPFRLPAVHGPSLNDSPDLGENAGEWTGLLLAPGTYSLAMWAWYEKDLAFALEHNLYSITSDAARVDLLVEEAGLLEPYALISSGANCQACHQELLFHGGHDRGFDACIACHGTAGAEDRPRYVSANAPATSRVTVSFRTLLHQIHMGKRLEHADDFFTVGEGPDPWPDDWERNEYGSILFPAMPGGVLQCTKCHGESNQAWEEPAERDHPRGQDEPVRAWAAVCAGCHDSDGAIAHIDSQTSPSGAEACDVCHGIGRTWSVELFHEAR